MRIVDVISCIPSLVLALAICAAMGNGVPQLVFALFFTGIPMPVSYTHLDVYKRQS